VPATDPYGLRAALDHLLKAMERQTVASCHDLSHGGLAVAAAEMCLGGDLGADLDTAAMDPARWDVQLFSESNGRWLVEVAAGKEDEFQHLLEGVPLTYLGRTGGRSLRLHNPKKRVALPVAGMRKAWSEAIPKQVVVS